MGGASHILHRTHGAPDRSVGPVTDQVSASVSLGIGREADGAEREDLRGTSRLNPEQFAKLYQDHWRMLWCVAAGVLGPATSKSLASDVVQQAAVIALGKLQDFEAGTAFGAWMSTIVRNTALNEARKRSRRRVAGWSEELDDPADNGRSPERAATNEPMDAGLRAALDELDETARSCLLMRTIAEMSYKSIGLALGIPEGTAASHVHRAKAAMRRRLSPSLSEPSRSSANEASEGSA